MNERYEQYIHNYSCISGSVVIVMISEPCQCELMPRCGLPGQRDEARRRRRVHGDSPGV
jgi:hypothetical protein